MRNPKTKRTKPSERRKSRPFGYSPRNWLRFLVGEREDWSATRSDGRRDLCLRQGPPTPSSMAGWIGSHGHDCSRNDSREKQRLRLVRAWSPLIERRKLRQGRGLGNHELLPDPIVDSHPIHQPS